MGEGINKSGLLYFINEIPYFSVKKDNNVV